MKNLTGFTGLVSHFGANRYEDYVPLKVRVLKDCSDLLYVETTFEERKMVSRENFTPLYMIWTKK